jgi:hypothetical protein
MIGYLPWTSESSGSNLKELGIPGNMHYNTFNPTNEGLQSVNFDLSFGLVALTTS